MLVFTDEYEAEKNRYDCTAGGGGERRGQGSERTAIGRRREKRRGGAKGDASPSSAPPPSLAPLPSLWGSSRRSFSTSNSYGKAIKRCGGVFKGLIGRRLSLQARSPSSGRILESSTLPCPELGLGNRSKTRSVHAHVCNTYMHGHKHPQFSLFQKHGVSSYLRGACCATALELGMMGRMAPPEVFQPSFGLMSITSRKYVTL
nr:uncharacterized protein LOC105493157 [Macaca nemestrina]